MSKCVGYEIPDNQDPAPSRKHRRQSIERISQKKPRPAAKAPHSTPLPWSNKLSDESHEGQSQRTPTTTARGHNDGWEGRAACDVTAISARGRLNKPPEQSPRRGSLSHGLECSHGSLDEQMSERALRNILIKTTPDPTAYYVVGADHTPSSQDFRNQRGSKDDDTIRFVVGALNPGHHWIIMIGRCSDGEVAVHIPDGEHYTEGSFAITAAEKFFDKCCPPGMVGPWAKPHLAGGQFGQAEETTCGHRCVLWALHLMYGVPPFMYSSMDPWIGFFKILLGATLNGDGEVATATVGYSPEEQSLRSTSHWIRDLEMAQADEQDFTVLEIVAASILTARRSSHKRRASGLYAGIEKLLWQFAPDADPAEAETLVQSVTAQPPTNEIEAAYQYARRGHERAKRRFEEMSSRARDFVEDQRLQLKILTAKARLTDARANT
ncbi:hypothetical protein M409DRAFT_31185, partial [Zasmidium cellare ATCC 36951]